MMYVWGEPLKAKQAGEVLDIDEQEALELFRELKDEYEEREEQRIDTGDHESRHHRQLPEELFHPFLEYRKMLFVARFDRFESGVLPCETN